MARKTYHHLNVGDFVVVERVEWDGSSHDLTVKEQYTYAEVKHVGAKQVKITVDWKGTECSFSRQGGQEWGSSLDGWRIAPAFAQPKGVQPKPYVPPKGLPSNATLRTDYEEYPGQPLVCAAAIVSAFPSPEAAAVRCVGRDGTPLNFCTAEGSSEVPGAGGQASKAAFALMAYRKHGSIDKVIAELHDGWRNTVGGGNHDKAFEPGQQKAEALEPMLRAALAAWF